MPWFKKQALSGEWTAYIEAQSESDVKAMHAMDQALPASKRRYPGPFLIEKMAADFELPCNREPRSRPSSTKTQRSREHLVLLFSAIGVAAYKHRVR